MVNIDYELTPITGEAVRKPITTNDLVVPCGICRQPGTDEALWLTITNGKWQLYVTTAGYESIQAADNSVTFLVDVFASASGNLRTDLCAGYIQRIDGVLYANISGMVDAATDIRYSRIMKDTSVAGDGSGPWVLHGTLPTDGLTGGTLPGVNSRWYGGCEIAVEGSTWATIGPRYNTSATASLQGIGTAYSTDGGVTWSAGLGPGAYTSNPALFNSRQIVEWGGVWYISMRGNTSSTPQHWTSTDLITWSNIGTLGITPASNGSYSFAVADPLRVWHIWSVGSPSHRFRHSEDDPITSGSTWTQTDDFSDVEPGATAPSPILVDLNPDGTEHYWVAAARGRVRSIGISLSEPVVPEAPTQVPITECGTFGEVVLPVQDGVIYEFTQGDGFQGPWTVIATPEPGTEFAEGAATEWSGHVGFYFECRPSVCQADWRVDVMDLATGVRQQFVTPLSLDFDQLLNEVGNASATLPVRSVTMAQVWPHKTAIAFARINGPGASPSFPKGEFIGIVETAVASSAGTVALGLKSVESYLAHRLIHGDTTFTAEAQTDIAADLVNLASSNGIQLTGVAVASAITRDREYLDEDRKVILEAILQLTEVIDGPDYELVHTLSGGVWSTEMIFSDYLGNTTPVPVHVRRGVSAYDLSVDAGEHANRVIGVGDDPTLEFDADESGTSIYPLFETSISWSDVSVLTTLQEHAEGAVANSLHPLATPSITLAGLDIAPLLGLGDTIMLTMDHGAILYQGLARLVGKSWSSNTDSPTMITLTLVPLDNTEDSILQAIAGPVPCC